MLTARARALLTLARSGNTPAGELWERLRSARGQDPTAPVASCSHSPPALLRGAATLPPDTIYQGPSSPSPKRVTLKTLRAKYVSGVPISMCTAYGYPSAVHVDEADMDILLVGDSVAMVVHGHDTTLPITLDEMLVHCRAAARGAHKAFLIGDLPFGCYETGPQDAVRSAVRMLKEGGMDAVKLEGGSPARVEAARAIVEAGVAVMGHVGLTPQSVSALGGFRPQAQVADEAMRVLLQAQSLQAAGCFSLLLECIPSPIGAAITSSLSIPTIGIGAGHACSGQARHAAAGTLTFELLRRRPLFTPRRCATPTCPARCRCPLVGSRTEVHDWVLCSGAGVPRPARHDVPSAPRQGDAQVLQAVRAGGRRHHRCAQGVPRRRGLGTVPQRKVLALQDGERRGGTAGAGAARARHERRSRRVARAPC